MQLSLFCFIATATICLPITLGEHLDKRVVSNQAAPPSRQVARVPARNAHEPAPEIQSLIRALAGKWSTQEIYEPAEMTRNGGTGHGQTIFRPGPGGFTLLEEYRAETPAGPLFGFGIIWWDPSKGLQHMWCINIYPDGCEMFPAPPQPGPQWDGKRLVLHVESEQGGKKMVFHEVISDITKDSYTQSADIGEAGAPLKRWFTIHATRVSTAAIRAKPSGSRTP
jgi:hypothetical protein